MKILRDPFADLACCQPYNRVLIGVVIRRTMEDRNAQQAFLEQVFIPCEGLLHQVSQEIWVPFTVAEQRTGKHLFQLETNFVPLGFGAGNPVVDLAFSFHHPALSLRVVPRLRRTAEKSCTDQRSIRASSCASLIAEEPQNKGIWIWLFGSIALQHRSSLAPLFFAP